jgi:hypothetical protein
MFFFLQIVFHQDVETLTTGGNGFWWDFLKDFCLPLLLGGLAAYMAYFIFIKETKRDKANEQTRKDEERNDKLIFFSALVESALRTSVQQKNNIKEQIRDIRKNNVEFHLMTQVPLYDLKRITEVLDLEDYLLSYTNHYHKDRKSSVKEFKNLIACTDFLHDIFKQIIDQLQKGQVFDTNRKSRYQDIYANAHNLLGKLMIGFERFDPESHTEIIKLLETFSKNHPGQNFDIIFYQKHFFIPFNDFCTKYLSEGRRVTQEILDLAVFTRDGKQLFDEIRSQNDILRESLTGDFKNIYRTLMEFRENSEKLINDF